MRVVLLAVFLFLVGSNSQVLASQLFPNDEEIGALSGIVFEAESLVAADRVKSRVIDPRLVNRYILGAPQSLRDRLVSSLYHFRNGFTSKSSRSILDGINALDYLDRRVLGYSLMEDRWLVGAHQNILLEPTLKDASNLLRHMFRQSSAQNYIRQSCSNPISLEINALRLAIGDEFTSKFYHEIFPVIYLELASCAWRLGQDQKALELFNAASRYLSSIQFANFEERTIVENFIASAEDSLTLKIQAAELQSLIPQSDADRDYGEEEPAFEPSPIDLKAPEIEGVSLINRTPKKDSFELPSQALLSRVDSEQPGAPSPLKIELIYSSVSTVTIQKEEKKESSTEKPEGVAKAPAAEAPAVTTKKRLSAKERRNLKKAKNNEVPVSSPVLTRTSALSGEGWESDKALGQEGMPSEDITPSRGEIAGSVADPESEIKLLLSGAETRSKRKAERLHLATRAAQLAVNTDQHALAAKGYLILGKLTLKVHNKEAMDESFKHYKSARNEAQKVSDHGYLESRALRGMGESTHGKVAVEYFMEALRIAPDETGSKWRQEIVEYEARMAEGQLRVKTLKLERKQRKLQLQTQSIGGN